MSRKKEGPLLTFLIKRKIARSMSQANAILLVVILINFFITGATIARAYYPNTKKVTHREDIPSSVLKTFPEEILKQIPSRGK